MTEAIRYLLFSNPTCVLRQQSYSLNMPGKTKTHWKEQRPHRHVLDPLAKCHETLCQLRGEAHGASNVAWTHSSRAASSAAPIYIPGTE